MFAKIARDGHLRLLARRIDHPDQPQEGQIMFDTRIHILAPEGIFRQRSRNNSQRAQIFAGQLFVLLQNVRSAIIPQRPGLFSDKLV
ncbi:MAG: hypothetical protein AB7F94_14390 [Nitrospira sp.]